MVSWKEDCDFIPDFDFDFNCGYKGLIMEKIDEVKKLKVEGVTYEKRYSPGFNISIKMIKNPSQSIINIFLPSFVLAISLISTFLIELESIGDRLSCLSISLLAYISILKSLRGGIPALSSLTSGDKLLFVWILTSCFPLFHIGFVKLGANPEKVLSTTDVPTKAVLEAS